MVTYVKIETFNSATKPASSIKIKRVVLADGTNTTEALKTAIKDAAKIITIDSDELFINDVKATDATIDISGDTKIGYKVYLVKRDDSAETERKRVKDLMADKLIAKFPRQAAAYRATRSSKAKFADKFLKNKNQK
jgi:hypothetical protein